MSDTLSVFETLNAVNVNGHTEKKNNLTYLSWAWAWAEVKKAFPDARYTIYETPDGCIYWTDGRTCWVKTGVTINELEHIEYLPVMDFRNAAIPLEKVTSTDVNKAIQRSLTKACARHGLGLYIYAGEDLPESEQTEQKATPTSPETTLQVVTNIAKTSLKGYALRTKKDSKTVNEEARTFIGKAYNDFTVDDWRSVAKEFDHRK